MHIIDVSASAPDWSKKYMLAEGTYASYGAYAPMAAGNTGIERLLPYFGKREWTIYDRE